jgi:hypothetical protein
MDQVSIKYTNIFHCKTLQNLPKFGFSVWKQTIWQPCFRRVDEAWVFLQESHDRLIAKNWARHFFRFGSGGIFWDVLRGRVARWNIFGPKIAIWVNLGGPCHWRCWYTLCTFSLFYDYSIYFINIWCILWSYGTFHTCWYIFQEKSGNPAARNGSLPL